VEGKGKDGLVYVGTRMSVDKLGPGMDVLGEPLSGEYVDDG